MPSFERNPSTQGHKILSQKTTVLAATQGEDFVILACTILIGLQSVTDVRTDDQATAKTREAFCYRA